VSKHTAVTGLVVSLFVLGAVIGSFLTVVAHRLPRNEQFVTGRSRCPSCGATIPGRDNVPILSWLALRGRCRSCGEPISPRYPLAELATAVSFAITALALGTDDIAQLVLGLVLCALLVVITLTDLEFRVIPNAVVLLGSVIALGVVAATDPDVLDQRLLAAGIGGGALFLLAMVYPRGMGMGDVKLVAMMGLYLGRALAPAVLVGFLAGAIVGVALMVRHGAAARKRAVPFGPFLAFGGLIGLWFGEDMVDWYLDEFFPAD
jgi:leader peptidase (prepilin peptidase)/N-methyltransferase